MSDPVFFPPPRSLSLADVVALTGALPPPGADLSVEFDAVASLDEAGRRSLTVFRPSDSVVTLARTRAGACFIERDRAAFPPAHTIALLSDMPREAFARAVAALYPDATRPTSMFATRGVSPAAFIHFEARIEADVIVDPGVVIGPKAEIGAGTIIGANTVIGPEVRIGRGCAIGAHVTIGHALIGNHVMIAPGVRIGQDDHERSDHVGLGRTIIQDSVSIGANSTIDRGGLGDTILGEACRIGSLVHIARDRTIARHAVVRGL